MLRIAICPGRYNGFHLGHASLIKSAFNDGNDLVYIVIVQGKKSSLDKKKNPLSYELKEKIIIASNTGAVPMMAGSASVALILYQVLLDSHTQNDNELHFTVYCGTDRVKAYKYQLIEKYFEMAKEDANRHDVQITGEVKELPRTDIPISASQIRQMIVDGNDEEAKKWLPFDNDRLYGEMRQAILAGVTESIKERVNKFLERMNHAHSIQIG